MDYTLYFLNRSKYLKQEQNNEQTILCFVNWTVVLYRLLSRMQSVDYMIAKINYKIVLFSEFLRSNWVITAALTTTPRLVSVKYKHRSWP